MGPVERLIHKVNMARVGVVFTILIRFHGWDSRQSYA
jgi:hypothetical protein